MIDQNKEAKMRAELEAEDPGLAERLALEATIEESEYSDVYVHLHVGYLLIEGFRKGEKFEVKRSYGVAADVVEKMKQIDSVIDCFPCLQMSEQAVAYGWQPFYDKCLALWQQWLHVNG